MPFYDYVRVRAKGDVNGPKFSVIASSADESVYDLLDEPATDSAGTPLPAEYPEPAPTLIGQKAKNDKEND